MTGTTQESFNFIKIAALLAGPIFFLIVLNTVTVEGLSADATQVIAVGIWMVIWWMAEAVPLPVTALLPLVLFPVLDVFSTGDAASPYASPIVFLFMGGFLIALAMEKRNLHRRIALNIIRVTGTDANGIILGFMIATAFLSMWISNTATTVMMLPIALSVVDLLRDAKAGEAPSKGYRRFALCLMLGIAYAANIGGTTTIIGTPPNVVFVGYMQEFYQRDIEFGRWLYIGIPVCLTLLTITYLMMTRVLFPHRLKKLTGSSDLIHDKLKELGPMSRAEQLVAVIFFLTAVCWIFQSSINNALGGNYLDNTIVAMGGGVLMFITPVSFREQEFVLDWQSTQRLPWGILLLFGGGLCLAKGMESTGIVQLVGDKIAGSGEINLWVLLLLLTAFMLFMTEIMSNVALTVIFIPVVLGIADSLEVNPLYLAIPVTLAASCAFMMPISTPPNAVVFSSGHIRMFEMVRAGFFLNLISILVLLLVGLTLVRWVYG
ncbi:sodium-dependent dicarboxylate transporter 2/3/5 [Catalinimonas alkaloidigena]|uniref:SLC13 family permease n=1 Tax=Catalinimonas alkaloidigena TaxID=1075417 RepID=UPI002407749E|nr:DASS family sodium-coupled anion symporter [Catalinimonas alkaloidigena]MDF9800337.1 sodium-dependent dicarboxylate transporter 2/3/5 [Catalinimonas alkaloidigena]